MNLDVVVRDGKRWIRCAVCVGDGMIPVVYLTADNRRLIRTVVCPDCAGKGEVEVP